MKHDFNWLTMPSSSFSILNPQYYIFLDQFGKDCSVTIEYVDEDKIFYAEYYGHSELPSYCNDMSFVGRDDGYLNEYEICVTPVTYEDPDCSMELRYSSDYSGYDDVQVSAKLILHSVKIIFTK